MVQKTRNQKSNCFSVLLIILFLFGSVFGAFAEAPNPNAQVPGYYRINVGEFQITALLDGSTPVDGELFFGISDEEKEELLSQQFISGVIPSNVSAFLINTGSKLVLVDAGSGDFFGPLMGQLPAILRVAGYKTHQIDAVLITHAHPDHIGGLLDSKGKAVFSKATVYMSQPEADFWLSAEIAAHAPEALLPLFEMAQKTEAVYSSRGRWKTFNDGENPVPGIPEIKAFLTPGHTVGMAAFEITSENERIIIWGDVVNLAAFQLPRPFVGFAYDLDPQWAAASRIGQLESVSLEKTLVAGSHLPFPSLGHIRKDDVQSYSWVPVFFDTLSAQ